MIPAFGFAPLPIAVALGISLIVSYVTMRVQPDPPMDDDEKTAFYKQKFVGQLARPFLALLFGWIVSLYVPKDMKPLNQPTNSVEANNKAVLQSLASDIADSIVEAE